MAEWDDWPRVKLTKLPGGGTVETEQAAHCVLLAACERAWARQEIPVVAWPEAGELVGVEITPADLQEHVATGGYAPGIGTA